jgi:hypothetical protein
VTPDQARKVQLAAALVGAHARGDEVGLDVLLGNFSADVVQDNTEGLILLASACAGILASLRGVPLETVLTQMPERDEGLIPITPQWGVVLDFLRHIEDHRYPQPPSSFDVPTELGTAFNVAVAFVHAVADALGSTPAGMAEIMAVQAATET